MALLPPLPAKFKGPLAACAVALVLFAMAAVNGERGLMDLLHLRSEQQELERVAFQLQQRNEALRQRIRRLQTDDAYIEKLARERLGLAKKGEIIYRVAEPPAGSRR